MINRKFFVLFLIVTRINSQNTNSLLLSKIVDVKYQCNTSGCSPSNTISLSNIKTCHRACLMDTQCRTVTFDTNNNQCEIFVDIPSQYGNLSVHIGVITMIAIDQRQLSAPMANSTTITSTTSTSTSSSTSSTTTSSTTTSTTTTVNPCTSGNLRWNTTGITILNYTQVSSVVGLYLHLNNTLYIADEYVYAVVWKLLNNAVSPIVAAGIAASPGSSSSQLSYPQDVYVDRNESVYVSDYGNHRIQKYIQGSMNGTTIAGITGTSGSALNQLNNPRFFTFDATDTYMYIADHANHRIMRYLTNSTSGTNGVIMAGGTQGNTNTTLNGPWGIQFLPALSNDFFITNFNGHSVMRWTPGASSGIFIAGTPGVSGSTSTSLNSPMGIKIDNYLNMYVVDSYNHRIQMFCANSKNGSTIVGTGVAGNNAQQLNQPRDIEFDAAMNMYVSDFNNFRVQKFMKL